MTIEELNKIIQEELKAYLNEEEEVDTEGGDDIEVTTDEPEEGGEDGALDTLRQIYDMLKPIVEPEGEEEPIEDEEPDEEEGEEEPAEEETEEVEEAVGYSNHRADQISKVKADADDVNTKLNESVARFKKLANING